MDSIQPIPLRVVCPISITLRGCLAAFFAHLDPINTTPSLVPHEHRWHPFVLIIVVLAFLDLSELPLEQRALRMS
ncbi:hypothetical protein F5141DRAFT_1113481 [Pisolithus sp. B1]|nr:hypothetical protein F5141DRAFT_1113481 [Pisolithus sp. B1]